MICIKFWRSYTAGSVKAGLGDWLSLQASNIPARNIRNNKKVLESTMKKIAAAVAAVGMLAAPWSMASDTPTVEDLYEIIKQQGAEISALKEGQEATAEALEEGSAGAGGAASWTEKTQLGGYAELHYNNLSYDGPDAMGVTGDKDEIDLHRFVLFIAHQFSDSVRFFSELEVEHSLAGEGKKGEVEVEQAYVEWDVAEGKVAKAGLFLVPVGILNETHEPDAFYGVERNNVEKNIIPTTWWEGGAAISGSAGNAISYDVAVHSGLYVDVASRDFKIRSGRQKVSEAKADEFAYTGRIKYNGIEGLELAATVQHQEDLTQGEGTSKISANLYEAHAAFQQGAFGLKALYAMWDIDSDINAAAAGADKQTGFFVEPSYRVNDKLGVFARYSEWDNQAGSSAIDSGFEQIDIGLNYWLSETAVLKADYQNQRHDDDTQAADGFNLGVGLSF